MLAVLLYDQKRTRHSSFAPVCLPASSSIALNRPCRSEGRQSAASEAKMQAAMPRSFAAAGGLATENQSVLVLKGAFLYLLTVLLQGALHVLELERVDSWSSV